MALSFELDPAQVELRERIAGFAREVVAPRVRAMDRDDVFPRELWTAFAEQGLQAMPIAKQYGGSEASLVDQTLMMEELTAWGHAPVCIALIEATALFTQAVNIAGTQEQKQRFLSRIAQGEICAAFALTEPGVGSDPAGMKTRAVRDGDHYVISGHKRYVSFAYLSDLVVVFASTDPEAGAKGISAFVVEPDREGFRVDKKIPCVGMRGHQDEEVVLDGVRVPVENRIGEEGKGLSIALGTLQKTRTTLCGGYVGLARACLDAALWYAQRRESFGKTLGEHQALRFPMAEVRARIEGARWTTYAAAAMADRGERHTVETAMAKILATEAMLQGADTAFQVYGGFAGTQHYVVERYYRDAKIWSYAQGSPEIMREVVARRLLKTEAREPLV